MELTTRLMRALQAMVNMVDYAVDAGVNGSISNDCPTVNDAKKVLAEYDIEPCGASSTLSTQPNLRCVAPKGHEERGVGHDFRSEAGSPRIGPDELLRRLLSLFYADESGLQWGYREDVTVGGLLGKDIESALLSRKPEGEFPITT